MNMKIKIKTGYDAFGNPLAEYKSKDHVMKARKGVQELMIYGIEEADHREVFEVSEDKLTKRLMIMMMEPGLKTVMANVLFNNPSSNGKAYCFRDDKDIFWVQGGDTLVSLEDRRKK